jgi:hypothetical protein
MAYCTAAFVTREHSEPTPASAIKRSTEFDCLLILFKISGLIYLSLVVSCSYGEEERAKYFQFMSKVRARGGYVAGLKDVRKKHALPRSSTHPDPR